MNYKVKLSPYHKTFYYEWIINPKRTDYHIVIDQIVTGNLDIKRLETALEQLIIEFTLMNSHIVNENDELYWIKNDKINNLIYIETNNYDNQLHKYIEEPFDLEKGPLYRFYLFKNGLENYRLLIIGHHIIFDGSSGLEFYNTVTNFYNNKIISNIDSIDEKIIELKNIFNNLNKNVNDNEDEMYSFWENKLKDCEPVSFDFLSSYKKEDIQTSKKNTLQDKFGIEEIEFELNSNLREIKEKYQISNYLLSKIVFAITIYKYTQQEKFCISYPIAIKEGIEFKYGAHVNLNFIPFVINDELSFENIIEYSTNFVNEIKNKKTKYGYFPYYKLHILLKKKLDSLIFSSTNFQNINLNFIGTETRAVKNSYISLVNDIIFESDGSSKDVNFRVVYKKDKISKELIHIFIRNYLDIYNAIVQYFNENKKLDIKISNINFSNMKKSINQISFNVKRNNENIVSLFEEQVLKTPNNIAFVNKSLQLSYEELNEKANQLAHYLRNHYDLPQESLVALYLERTENMLISILAVLKAGYAYVPIGLDYPESRIQYILKDTQSKLLLTNENAKEKIIQIIKNMGQENQIQFACVDSEEAKLNIARHSSHNLKIEMKEKQIAYVIYTSGTTGIPKGVLITHKGVVNLIEENRLLLEKSEMPSGYLNCLWYSNYVFDGHVWELSSSIFNGHTLHMISDELRTDINLLSQYISEHHIDYSILPPALLDKAELLKLKLLVVGGDRVNKEIIECYLKSKVKIINAYGPTEVTVKFSYHIIKDVNEINCIGRSLNNLSGYVLDKNLKRLPLGAIGELYIGGEGVARGYLNREDLTKERFIANPYQTEEENKLGVNDIIYKTGDLVRQLPNGEFIYIGRNDTQVKIRGYRIELSEIENAVLSYPSLLQAAVIAKSLHKENEEYDNNRTLICYYVEKAKTDSQKLKDYLSDKLPNYMVPSYYVKLEILPLNSSGKLDIKALPDPEVIKSDSYVAP